jgi:hypothetical protein
VDYSATVDWPGATLYAALAETYPEAKVILTDCEPESWFRSTQATIFPNATPPDTDVPFDQMFRKVIGRLFNYRMRDHDSVIEVYKRHNAEVRRRIAPDRLLVYEITQGWEPLCRVLGVSVPAIPMPKTNSSEELSRFRGYAAAPLAGRATTIGLLGKGMQKSCPAENNDRRGGLPRGFRSRSICASRR